MSQKEQISNQDYNLIKISTEKIVKDYNSDYNLYSNSTAFIFLVISKIYKLQDDEILEGITDTIFLKGVSGVDPDPDRGVDFIYIDRDKNIIHIFNFKYQEGDIERIKTKHFPSSEIDTVLSFVRDVYEKNEENFSKNLANERLIDKVREVWNAQKQGVIFQFKIHFVSNLFQGLVKHEEDRLKSNLKDYKNDVSFDYILVGDISSSIIEREIKVNSKFQALSRNFFEKSDNGNRALILEISALDLLKITTSEECLRSKIDFNIIEILNSPIEEAVFDDNVRIYLKQRTNINKNIKRTALDDRDRLNIFFYNNGITITCDKFEYQSNRNPIISLTNFQIVNGGQTIHALRSAFDENQENFEDITLLCKIYETNSKELKDKIAEYTNSQNPVRNRDIRSIDSVQIKLEQELCQLGFFYERKRGQHDNKSKDKRIDSEKLGQVLLSFNLEMPAEAKDKKRIIFAEKYDDIFNDSISAEEVLRLMFLYNKIEKRKLELKKEKPFLMYATYYILFFIKRLSKDDKPEDLFSFYDNALSKIDYVINKEKNRMKDDYLDSVLFRSNRIKDYLTELGL